MLLSASKTITTSSTSPTYASMQVLVLSKTSAYLRCSSTLLNSRQVANVNGKERHIPVEGAKPQLHILENVELANLQEVAVLLHASDCKQEEHMSDNFLHR